MAKVTKAPELAGMPEYPDNANTQRLAAMQANRAKRFAKAFPSEELRVAYLRSHLETVTR